MQTYSKQKNGIMMVDIHLHDISQYLDHQRKKPDNYLPAFQQ